MRTSLRYITALILTFFSMGAIAQQTDKQELFKDVEIRVIKQKYFQKTNRFEFQGNFNAIMSAPFIFTMTGNAQLGFHINEQFGLFGEGGIGYSGNKTECTMLGEKFRIEPIVYYPQNWYGGGATYTPIYGKYQLANGDVLYFDWFFSLEVGLASLVIRNSSCIPELTGNSPLISNQMQYIGSTGQRFFLNKDIALIWNLKYLAINLPGNSIISLITGPKQFIMLSAGVSYFL